MVVFTSVWIAPPSAPVTSVLVTSCQPLDICRIIYILL